MIPFSVVSFNESYITIITWQEWFHCPRHLAQLSRGSRAPGRRFCSSCCLRGGRVRFEFQIVSKYRLLAVWGEAESGSNQNLYCLKISGRVRFEFKSILLENVEQGCEWECEWESERKRWQMKKQRDSSWECENVQGPTFSSQTLGMTGVALFALALLQILSKDLFISQKIIFTFELGQIMSESPVFCPNSSFKAGEAINFGQTVILWALRDIF